MVSSPPSRRHAPGAARCAVRAISHFSDCAYGMITFRIAQLARNCVDSCRSGLCCTAVAPSVARRAWRGTMP
jgi:hypothetical protein